MGKLFVQELRLSHFRSHRDTRLELPPGMIALYGPNGAGKTNILEAVSLLSPGRGLRRAGAEDMARRPESIGWKIGARLESLAHTHEIATLFEPGGGRQVRIDGKPASQIALGRISRILWLVPAMDRLWIEGAEGRRRFLDRMALSLFPDHAEAALTYEKAMRERNRLLRDGGGDGAWFRALEGRMAESGARLIANRRATLSRLSAAQDAGSAFPAAELELLDPAEAPVPDRAADLALALRQGRGRDMAAGRSLTGPHRADLAARYARKGIAARDCSTGEQKALLISLVLANARALAQDFGAPPILLLDEVAAHLDPDRRAALFGEIGALGAQAWLTGTEAALFRDLGPGAAALAVSEEAGNSRITEGSLR